MKTKLFKKPFIYWIFGISFLYLLFTILISKFYITLWYLPRFAATLNWTGFLISVSFSLFIAFFVGLNAVGSYLLYKQKKEQKTCSLGISATKTASITGFGALVGTTTGICTACVGALFPAFFGLFATIFVHEKTAPKRPANWSLFKRIWSYIQWLLVPLILITISSVPAIDAQTSLMFGKKLEFRVTNKARLLEKA